MTATNYRAVNPEGWPRPRGYSHATISQGATQVRIAGQVATEDGQAQVRPDTAFGQQWLLAMRNVVTVVRAAGGEPTNITMLRAYVADMDEFRRSGAEVGTAWAQTLGKHFPAMTLVQVSGFVDPHASVEIEAEAVLP